MVGGVTAYNERSVEFEGNGEQIESALLEGSGASEHIKGSSGFVVGLILFLARVARSAWRV